MPRKCVAPRDVLSHPEVVEASLQQYRPVNGTRLIIARVSEVMLMRRPSIF
jgi:hypothetical protein